jgi:hypothetical protein
MPLIATYFPDYKASQKFSRFSWERRHLACKKTGNPQCRLEACAPRKTDAQNPPQIGQNFENSYISNGLYGELCFSVFADLPVE